MRHYSVYTAMEIRIIFYAEMDMVFIAVCNREDIKEKVYDPLEATIGKPHVEVHPNICGGAEEISMEKIFIIAAMVILVLQGFSQGKHKFPEFSNATPYPPTKIYDTTTYWADVPIQNVLNLTQVAFEGKVLSDSIFISNSHTYTYHLVQVLKLFKGEFSSDTVAIATGGGGTTFVDGLATGDVQYGRKGDIAFFSC